MCTCLIVGRNASATGRAMLAANDDWDGVPGVLTRVPGGKHRGDATQKLVCGYRIPQPPVTFGYSYTACHYSIGTLDRGWAGGMNDCGVAVAGTGASAFKDIPCPGALLEPDDVPLLILQRARSSRHAVTLIGELVEKYGFGPSNLDGCRSMATFAVADSQEGWFLEMAPGNHWVAVRVPDDEAGVRANAFGSHDIDLTDPENTLASPGLADYARSRGWWTGDDRTFDFAFAYGADKSPNEWGPELDKMNMLRRWRAMYLLSGRDDGEENRVYSVRPSRPLRIQDLTRVLRDVYEGTAHDLTKAPAAGRWGNPYHDDPTDYSLCKVGTVASIAADLYPQGPGILWTALATPAMSAYFPVYSGITALPRCCGGYEPEKLGSPSLFWELKELNYLFCRRYSKNMSVWKDILLPLEEKFFTQAEEERASLAAASELQRPPRATLLTARHIGELRAAVRASKVALLKMY